MLGGIYTYIKTLRWLRYNYLCSRKLNDIEFHSMGDYKISSLHLRDISKLIKGYKMSFGKQMSIRMLFSVLINRKKTCYLLTQKGNIVACNFFYFNQNEFDKGYIHRAFIFVTPTRQGLGVGKRFEKETLDLLRTEKILKGICSRVSNDNNSSMSLHKNYGFKIIEQYLDYGTNKERSYMLLKF